MQKLFLIAAIALTSLMGIAQITHAATAGPYHWDKAVLRETPASIGAAYVTLTNPTTQDDALVSAKADWAGRIELHQTSADSNGVMHMNKVEEMALPAQGVLELSQGGNHLMIFDISKKLVAGEKRSITLTFRQAGDIVIPFSTQPLSTSVQATAATQKKAEAEAAAEQAAEEHSHH